MGLVAHEIVTLLDNHYFIEISQMVVLQLEA